MSRPSIRLTQHAIERYRQRVNPKATTEDVRAELDSAAIRSTPPTVFVLKRASAAYAVTPRCCFFLMRSEAEGVDLEAVTCIHRPRKSKAERRALRELSRPDDDHDDHDLLGAA